MAKTKHRFGYIPDLADHRDYAFKAPMITLPPSVDLRPHCPPVYDQGNLGSCTGNAIAGAIQIMENPPLAPMTPSRLFIYYNERAMEGTIKSDSGAMIRDGIKSVAKQGVCDEKLWPYIISKFATKPSNTAIVNALKNVIHAYERVEQTETGIKSALATGFPVVYGFSVYSSFESAIVGKNGKVPMPKKNESLLGGHAVVACGYNKEFVTFRNSWGLWGDKGYGYMPWAYILNSNLASDMWVIKRL